jgi:quercetin dioxygenase-like cupin family protein
MTDPPIDLHALAGELLEKATSEHSGRAGRTLPHPVDGLRQTVIALRAGAELGEHESPGPASLMVIRGRVRLVADAESVELGGHQISPIPDRRHSLHADEDSVVLLSVAVPDRTPD